METFCGKFGIEPILFAFGVVADVGISHGRQFTGGVLGGVSGRAGAVDDDLGVLVGKQSRGECLHLVWRQIFCSWEMDVVVRILSEGLEKREFFAAVELRLQLVAADGLNRSLHAASSTHM